MMCGLGRTLEPVFITGATPSHWRVVLPGWGLDSLGGSDDTVNVQHMQIFVFILTHSQKKQVIWRRKGGESLTWGSSSVSQCSHTHIHTHIGSFHA